MALILEDSLPDSLDDALDQIKLLRDENTELSNDLEDCKDRLLQLLQKENDIPEQSIKQEFARIFGSIESWIDDVSGDDNFDFEPRWHSRMEDGQLDEMITSLGLDESCTDSDWLERLRSFGNCHYMVLSLVIARCLMEDIFRYKLALTWGNLYPLGFDEEMVDELVRSQKIMRSDAMRRDRTQVSRWRGETVSILLATEGHDDSESDHVKSCTASLHRELRLWLGKEVLRGHMGSLQTNVIHQAAKVLQMIGSSQNAYDLVFDPIFPGAVPTSAASWAVKDISTWRTVATKDVFGVLYCLYPGLRKRGASQNELLLVKPMLLGYPTMELEPEPHSRQLYKSLPRQVLISRDQKIPRTVHPRLSSRTQDFDAAPSSAPVTSSGILWWRQAKKPSRSRTTIEALPTAPDDPPISRAYRKSGASDSTYRKSSPGKHGPQP